MVRGEEEKKKEDIKRSLLWNLRFTKEGKVHVDAYISKEKQKEENFNHESS